MEIGTTFLVIDNLDWKRIYSVSPTSTNDVKLQNVYYKHLMRIIPTNKVLLKCHIEDSALFDFCSENIQTIIYFGNAQGYNTFGQNSQSLSKLII